MQRVKAAEALRKGKGSIRRSVWQKRFVNQGFTFKYQQKRNKIVAAEVKLIELLRGKPRKRF